MGSQLVDVSANCALSSNLHGGERERRLRWCARPAKQIAETMELAAEDPTGKDLPPSVSASETSDCVGVVCRTSVNREPIAVDRESAGIIMKRCAKFVTHT
jgi:hypothetical protein